MIRSRKKRSFKIDLFLGVLDELCLGQCEKRSPVGVRGLMRERESGRRKIKGDDKRMGSFLLS